MRPILFGASLIAVILAASASSSNALETAQSSKEVTEKKLRNGITYFIHEGVRPAGKVRLQLVVNVGAADEDIDEVQYAHLVEHIRFSEFKLSPSGRALENAGLKPGIDVNASAGWYTSYYFDVSADRPDLIAIALDALREMASAKPVGDHQVEIDKKGVWAEWDNADRAQRRNQDNLKAILTKGSKSPNFLGDYYALNERSFSLANGKSVSEFISRWYRPACQSIIVIGVEDLGGISREIEKRFSDIPDLGNEKCAKNRFGEYRLPLPAPRQFVEFPSVSGNYEGEIVFPFEGQFEPRLEENSRSSDIRDMIISSMIADRMKSLSVDRKGGNSITYLPQFLTPSQISAFSVISSSDSFDGMMSSMKENFLIYRSILKFGFSEDEVENAKSKLRYTWTSQSISNEDVTRNISDHFALGSWLDEPNSLHTKRLKHLNDISSTGINAYLAGISESISRPTVVIAKPLKEDGNYITKEQIFAMYDGWLDIAVPRSAIIPENTTKILADLETVGKLAASPAQAGRIKVGASTSIITKPHGLRIISAREKSMLFGDQIVMINAVIPRGTADLEENWNLENLNESLGDGYFDILSASSLKDLISERRIMVSISVTGPHSSEMHAIIPHSSLRAGLGLAHLVGAGKMKFDDGRTSKAYAEILGGLRDVDVIAVGDFETEELAQLISGQFSSVEGTRQRVSHRNDAPIAKCEGGHEWVIQRKTDSSVVYFRSTIPRAAPRSLAEAFSIDVVAGVIDRRLFGRLREADGLVYSVDTRPIISDKGCAVLTSNFTVKNEKLALAQHSLVDEFNKFRIDGVSQQEFDREIKRIREAGGYGFDSPSILGLLKKKIKESRDDIYIPDRNVAIENVNSSSVSRVVKSLADPSL
ncbi:Predicted Zn-dependent peptidase [Sphingopyxis sp. YR583]|nr:insulinase family protein [Sphingopyxis sp. YR583]SEH14974.1 Predicted Zn-dependent peptidase [Sphingopyxis sp. YR583]